MFALDLRSIALFRQLLALVGLWDLITRGIYAVDFYSGEGMLPRIFAISLTEKWSFHFISDAPFFQIFLFFIQAICLFLLWSGWKPKLSSFFVWILTLSMHARNEFINDGGDSVYRHLLFWSILLPSSAHFKTLIYEKTQRVSYRFSHLTTIGVFWLAVSLYTFSGYSKVISPLWQAKIGVMNGLWAEWYVSSIGQWFRSQGHRPLQFFNDFVLYLELLFVWVLLIPDRFETAVKNSNRFFSLLRMSVILSFVGMHLGIIILFSLGMFPYFCIVLWTLFLPTAFWDFFWKGSKKNLKLIFPEPKFFDSTDVTFSKNKNMPKKGFFIFSAYEDGLEKRFDFLSQCVATYSIVIGLFWNLTTANPRLFKNPNWARLSSVQLGMEQGWNLFIRPEPTLAWMSIVGKFQNGSIQELGFLKDAVSVKDKPKLLSAVYPSYKWREIEYRYMWGHYDQLKVPYSLYLCKKHPGLRSFMITQYLLPIESQVESKFFPKTERARGEWSCVNGALEMDRAALVAFRTFQK